jgi:hypothetical protein
LEVLNKQLDVNSGLEKEMLNLFPDALKNIDTSFNKINKQTNSFFRKDPIPGIRDADLACSRAKEPLLLPEHSERTPSGCGWWYIEDPNTPSFGSTGTKNGPFEDLKKKYPSGKWLWDLAYAQKMEDIKLCKKVKSCDIADLYPGKCAFCNPTGTGIPVDKKGKLKYPNDVLITCSEDPISKPSKCPKPDPPAPVTLPDGTVMIPRQPDDICNPVNGRLTLSCLIKLAKATGFTEQGAIVHILNGDERRYVNGTSFDSYIYKKAVDILFKEGKINTENAFIGKGACDRDDALNYYKSVVTAMGSGKTKRIKEVAAFLAIGTEYDPCDYDEKDMGPFELSCLTRLALEKGCQPDGTDFPSESTIKYNKMTWAAVNSYFDTLHRNLTSRTQSVLEDATKRCLGITINREPASCGEKTGCEILWYSWDYEWNFPDLATSSQIFYGRELKSTFPYFSTGDGSYNPFGKADRMSFHLRTNYISRKTFASKFWVMVDDGIAIKVDGKTVQKSWHDQGPTAYETTPFTIKEGKPTKIDFYWYENYGGATFISKFLYERGLNMIDSSELEMTVPKDFPLARWDFYNGTNNDVNNILSSQPTNIVLGSIDSKKGAALGKGSGIAINNQVRGGAFSSFTFMTYHRGGWARLFALRKGECNSGSWAGYSIEGGVCADSRVWFAMQKEGSQLELWLSTEPNSIPLNKWVHLAYVIDADFKGVSIYADGKKIGKMRNERISAENYKNILFNQVTIGHAKWSCNGTINPPPSKKAGPPVPSFEYQGCWGDSGDRAISNYVGQVSNAEQCFELAKQNNATVFGLQYYGQCFTGTNKDWNRFGKRDNVGCGPLGRDWTNQVYLIGKSNPPDCPPSKDGSLNIYLAWVHWFDYTMSADDVNTDRLLGFTDKKAYAEDKASGWKSR